MLMTGDASHVGVMMMHESTPERMLRSWESVCCASHLYPAIFTWSQNGWHGVLFAHSTVGRWQLDFMAIVEGTLNYCVSMMS